MVNSSLHYSYSLCMSMGFYRRQCAWVKRAQSSKKKKGHVGSCTVLFMLSLHWNWEPRLHAEADLKFPFILPISCCLKRNLLRARILLWYFFVALKRLRGSSDIEEELREMKVGYIYLLGILTSYKFIVFRMSYSSCNNRKRKWLSYSSSNIPHWGCPC